MPIPTKRKPGVKTKLNHEQIADIIKSDLKLEYLAHNYKVHPDTIRRIKRKNKATGMNIVIELQLDNLSDEDKEMCVFCNNGTLYWAVDFNRPCCPLCSVVNTNSDFDAAPYNY